MSNDISISNQDCANATLKKDICIEQLLNVHEMGDEEMERSVNVI